MNITSRAKDGAHTGKKARKNLCISFPVMAPLARFLGPKTQTFNVRKDLHLVL